MPDDLTWLRERVEAMSGARWQAQDCTHAVAAPESLQNFLEDTGHAARSMWWLSGVDWVDQDDVAEGLFFGGADADGIAALRNLAPAMLAVIEAADEEHHDDPWEEPKFCVCGRPTCTIRTALDDFRAAVREEQER